jgi:hypothetical protein
MSRQLAWALLGLAEVDVDVLAVALAPEIDLRSEPMTSPARMAE